MASSSELWAHDSPANAEIVVEEQKSVSERIAYLRSRMEPGAPMVGNSANASSSMSRAAGEAQSTVQSAAQNGGSGGAAANNGVEGDDDMLWQNALNRFEQETKSQGPDWNSDSDSDDDSRSQDENVRNRSDMDRMGSMEFNAGAEQPTGESMDHLSLWQTFQVLYKRNPMVKFYVLGLLILLVATAAIIGVSVAQKKEPSNGGCVESSLSDNAFLLLPVESTSVQAGGFGVSLSASQDYLIVGAPDSSCIGPPCDDTVGGGAYLYRRNIKNGWDLYSTFILDDGDSKGDKFGQSVAISHDSSAVVVGAPKDDSLGIVAGAIYVMEQPFASATPPISLTPLDIGFNDQFGGSVSVSTTTLSGGASPVRVTNIVAGASYDDDSGTNSGGVYVFTKFDGEPPANACGGDVSTSQVGSWVQCQKLLPDDGETNDQFGRTVDIADKTVVVGAMWNDDLGIDAGAAYVYSLDEDGNWSQQQKILPRNFYSQGNRFGVSVATSGQRIVVGADLDDALGTDSGSAYVFNLSSGVWSLESKLVPAKGAESHDGYECGYSVSISQDGRSVVVGCPGGGLAYVYDRQESGTWVQTEKLTGVDGYDVSDSSIGSSVARNADMAIVGYGKSDGEVFSYSTGC